MAATLAQRLCAPESRRCLGPYLFETETTEGSSLGGCAQRAIPSGTRPLTVDPRGPAVGRRRAPAVNVLLAVVPRELVGHGVARCRDVAGAVHGVEDERVRASEAVADP